MDVTGQAGDLMAILKEISSQGLADEARTARYHYVHDLGLLISPCCVDLASDRTHIVQALSTHLQM